MIKLFEEFNDINKIHEICKKYGIINYTINEDNSIDVYSTVMLQNSGLDKLPLTFNKVDSDFNCSYNKLTTLEGCPKVVNGDFYCNNNLLTSLEHAPLVVNGDFDCYENNLEYLDCNTDISGKFRHIK